jgi:hypothetical membrane protein
MHDFLDIGLIVFVVYLIALLFVLAKATLSWGNYSVKSCWVSELGITTKKSARAFNFAISLYGLLSLLLIFKLFYIMPHTNVSCLFLMFLTIISISTFFVGVFPMDTKPNGHLIASGSTFFSVLISSIISIYLVLNTHFFPRFILFLNITTLIILPLYTFAACYEKSAEDRIWWLKRIEKDRKEEQENQRKHMPRVRKV